MVGALNTQQNLTPVRDRSKLPAAQESQPLSPVDSLPDLSTIEARVKENAPGDQVPDAETGISGTKKAILATVGLATAGAALLGAAPQAHAGPRGHHLPNSSGANQHRHLVSDAGDFLGALFLGAIIGGAITQNGPPVYYPPTYPTYPTYPNYPTYPGGQVQRPHYDNYGRLICPNAQGGWYVSADNHQCW